VTQLRHTRGNAANNAAVSPLSRMTLEPFQLQKRRHLCTSLVYRTGWVHCHRDSFDSKVSLTMPPRGGWAMPRSFSRWTVTPTY